MAISARFASLSEELGFRAARTCRSDIVNDLQEIEISILGNLGRLP